MEEIMPVNLPNFLQAETRSYGPENLLESAIQGYQMSRMPKRIAQEEQQRELANILLGHQGVNEGIKSQYLPREYEANIGNTLAQSKLYGSQATSYDIKNAIEQAVGLQREKQGIAHSAALTNALNQLTPYQVKQLQEEIQGKQYANRAAAVDASLSEMLGSLVNNKFSQKPQSRMAAPFSEQAPYPARISEANGERNLAEMQAPIFDKGYEIDEIWRNNPLIRGKLEKLGVKGKVESKYDPKTGEMFEITTLPSGRVSVNKQQVGQTISEKERATHFAKSDVEAASLANDTAKSYLAAVDPAKKILAELDRNPKLSEEVTGPGNYLLSKYLGSEEAQKLIGNIEEAHGVLMTAQAGQFKGAFRAGEQSLIERMKGSLNDPLPVLRAKTQAIVDSSERLAKRNRIIAKNIRNGMTEEEAIDDAVEQTKFTDIEKNLNKATSEAKNLSGWVIKGPA